MSKKRVSTGLLAIFLFVTGCGSATTQHTTNVTKSSQVKQTSNPNAPFTSKLNIEAVTPDSKFDPVTVNGGVYNHVVVYSESGKQKVLDASQQPVMFEAYWCPHCQRTLVSLNKNRSQLKRMPILVSMGFQPGTTLQEAVQISHNELSTFHIQNVTVYYLLGQSSSRLVPKGYPTVVFPYHHGIKMLNGEHSFSVWKTAFNQ